MNRMIVSFVFTLPFTAGLALAEPASGKEVGITHSLPLIEVLHHGKPITVERNPDTDNMIDPDFALTSRPCPPYCISPMQIAEGG